MRAQFVKWTGGVLLLGCAAAAVGMWQLQARNAMRQWDPDRARSANLPIPVRTVRVDERELSETIGGTAVTLPFQSATIAIPLNSSTISDRTLTRVTAYPGAVVERGDLLFEFEPSLFEQLVKQREAVKKHAEQSLSTIVELYEKKAASGLQVKEAEVAVETASLELDIAKADLNLCVVNSPISGVVDSVNVVPDMRVTGEAVLAIIHQLDPLLVQMDFPMERLDSLRVGQTAEISLDAFPQETFQGRVTRILPVVSTRTRVLPVILEVENPNNRIRAGISGFVRVHCEKASATTVPSVAVINKDRKAMVFCVEGNRARSREVRTGQVVQAGFVEILDGLNAGEEVIVYGHDAVEEDDVVNVAWHQWAGRDEPASLPTKSE